MTYLVNDGAYRNEKLLKKRTEESGQFERYTLPSVDIVMLVRSRTDIADMKFAVKNFVKLLVTEKRTFDPGLWKSSSNARFLPQPWQSLVRAKQEYSLPLTTSLSFSHCGSHCGIFSGANFFIKSIT